MIKLHYLDNSRAHRILWLLEELGLEYEVEIYHRGSDMRGPDSLKAVHPLGKSPIIEDGDRVIAESGAIVEYLVETYGGDELRPTGSEERLRYSYWLHYAEGSAMPLLLLKLIFARLPGQVPWFLKAPAALICKGVSRTLVEPQLRDHIRFWNGELARDGWFAGKNFSAADIMMSFPVETAASRIDEAKALGAIRSYLAAIRARPAYQRALARGGAYVYAES